MAFVITDPLGILLPGTTLESSWFLALMAFVAVNTVMYVALAIAKAVPRLRARDLLPRRYRRTETRSIYPGAPR